MAEVGVLNLQIHDNSEKAVKGLGDLADALGRVKAAVSGVKLAPIANNLKKIASAVNNDITDSTISKLEQITNALSGLQGLGDVRITIKTVEASDARKKIEDVRQAVDEAVENGTATIENPALENVEQSIQSAGEAAEESFQSATESARELSAEAVRAQEAAAEAAQAAMDAIGRAEIAARETGTDWRAHYQAPSRYRQLNPETMEYEEVSLQPIDGSVYDEYIAAQKEIATRAREAKEAVAEMIFQLENPPSFNLGDYVKQSMNIDGPVKSAEESWKVFMQSMQSDSEIAETTRQLNPELQSLCDEAIRSGYGVSDLNTKMITLDGELKKKKTDVRSTSNSFADLSQQLNQNTTDVQGTTSAYERLRDRITALFTSGFSFGDQFGDVPETTSNLEQLKNKVNSMFKPLSKLASEFWRVAKRMAIRAVIKQVTSAFSEGVENVYRYSRAIGSSFSTKMDSAASSLLQMKNSIGAAVAPAIEALIPYLQTLVNWFIEAVNYVNQFFALLNGQTSWTKAVKTTTKAYDEQTTSAKKASSAVKELLADWDELNIIQSTTSGTGSTGGTGTATDYLKMFEQVSVFNQKVREIVNFIKDNFDTIKSIATTIGAAILAWKFSSGFTGVLGTLSLLAAGLTAKLVFDVSTLFTNQYLETGDEGWLIADVLTTFIGGTLMSKILQSVLGAKGGLIGIPLAFGISALATIVANVKKTDVSAFSETSLKADVTAALEGGAAAGYLAHLAGKSLGTSLAGAGVAAIATFGVAIGLKADMEIAEEGLTEDAIKAKLTGIGALATAGALTGTLVGGTAAAAAGMAMLFGGAPIATFGVSVGINAVNKAVDAGGITKEVVMQNLLSAGLTAAGVALSVSALFGTGIGLVAAGGAALLTLGVLFAIEATIDSKPAAIKWGNYNATKEELQNWLKEPGNGFGADISATMNLVDTRVNVTTQARTSITAQLTNLVPQVNTIKMGLATEETRTNLETALFGTDGTGGVIGDVKKYAKDNVQLIETSFTLMPVVSADGQIDEEATKEMMKSGQTGWSEVEKYMGAIGTQLAEALKGETVNGLKTFDDELILSLTNKITNVSKAITEAQASSEGVGGLMTGLSGLSQESFSEAIDIWTEYKDQLKEKYNQTLQEEYTSYKSLQAFYATRGNEGDELLAQKYGELADRLEAEWSTRLNAAVDRMAEPGAHAFKQAILEMMNVEVTPEQIRNAMDKNFFPSDSRKFDFVSLLFGEGGNIVDDGKETIENLLDQLITGFYGPENIDTIKKLIESGAMDYSDFIAKEYFEQLADGFIANAGTDEEKEQIRNTWTTFIDSVFEKPFVATPQVEIAEPNIGTATTASEVQETVTASSGTGVGNPVTKVQEETEAAYQATSNAVEQINQLKLDDITMDTSELTSSTNIAASAVEDMANRIREAFRTLDGLSYEMNVGDETYSGAMKVVVPTIKTRASGGFVKSGDLVMANENGKFEMMGRMGNQPVVANNQQIVSGISQGVTSANSGMESRLSTIENLLNQLLNKEFVARAVPSSTWGKHNAKSGDAYSKVTG